MQTCCFIDMVWWTEWIKIYSQSNYIEFNSICDVILQQAQGHFDIIYSDKSHGK